MPPSSNLDTAPLPPSDTNAGAEAANNALAAARAAVLNAAGTSGEASPPPAPGSGISPEGSGQSIGTITVPELSNEQPGTGLSSKVVDETLIPASTANTEKDANLPNNTSAPEAPATNEPPTMAAPVSPLDVLPPADNVKINVQATPPLMPHYADAAPGSNIPNLATAAEALAATPQPTTSEVFDGANQETEKSNINIIKSATAELLEANNPQAQFEAAVKLEVAARITQTQAQIELSKLETP